MQPVLLRIRGLGELSLAWPLGALGLVLLLVAVAAFYRQRRAGTATDLQARRWLTGALAGSAACGLLAWLSRAVPMPAIDWQITSSGASWVVAAAVAYTLTLGLAVRAGVPRVAASSAFFVAATSGLVVARVSYVALNPEVQRHWLSWLTVRDGGLLGYAGLLGGLGVGALWLSRQTTSLTAWRWLDSTAPGALLGAALVRVGCYVFGCDYGRVLPTDAARWLQRIGTYPRWAEAPLHGAGAPAFADQLRASLIPSDATHALPVHPTQLYAALLSLTAFGLLVWLARRLKHPGQLFGAGLLTLAVVNFSVEILRADADRGLLGPALEAKLLLGLGLLTLGLLACAGPARAVREARQRSALYLALLAPGVLWLVARGVLGGRWDAVAVSATQWLALLSAAAGALGVPWVVTSATPPGDATEPLPGAGAKP